MVGNILCFFKANTVPCKACRADQCQSAYVLGQRRANGRAGGGGGDADHALTATFRYFVGFHSAASRRASAIWAGVIRVATRSRHLTASRTETSDAPAAAAMLNHI